MNKCFHSFSVEDRYGVEVVLNKTTLVIYTIFSCAWLPFKQWGTVDWSYNVSIHLVLLFVERVGSGILIIYISL